jgi:hypothetical protein
LFYFKTTDHIDSAGYMPDQKIPPSIIHMFERNIGKKVRVIIDPAYGFEGILAAINQNPPGIWISNTEAILLRATIAQPIPQVASREERGDLFIHLNSVQRIEILQNEA